VLLALDVGNTNMVVGVFKPDSGLDPGPYWRISTGSSRTADEYRVVLRSLLGDAGISRKDISGVAISNVVPPLESTLEALSRGLCTLPPLVIGPHTDTGVKVLYDPLEEVGPDRVVNAAAAFHLYGGPAIVVDYGTATTFDAISAKGEYLGGAIAPGINISMEALFTHAARLRRIELKAPRQAIGNSMSDSLRSGILYGFAGQTDEMVRRFKRELGGDAAVVATGGIAELVANGTTTIQHVNPWLTLQGLKLIWDRQGTSS
jgi:type III pantothenate kinase